MTEQQTITRGYEYCIPKERLTGTATTVGDVVGFDGNGDLVPAASATTGTNNLRIIIPHYTVGMSEMSGRTDYDAGEQAKYVTPPPGTEALLNLAESQDVSDGESVVLAGTEGQVAAFDGAGGDTADMVIGEVVPGKNQSSGFNVTTEAGETAKITVEVK